LLKWIVLLTSARALMAAEPDFGIFDGTAVIADLSRSAKTGGSGGVGWFVGFVEEEGKTRLFAFGRMGEAADGTEAKKIALDYLNGER
jgi:beta-lactamase class D